MTAPNRNLIISPIGDGSVHESWLSDPRARTFDLMLVNYSNRVGFGRQQATHYVERKGFKWELVHHLLCEHRATIHTYSNIWIPDHDIRADTASINRLFDLFERYALQLAQPAIASGEVSYKTLRQRPGVVLRYSPFVEVMCPLFTRAALQRVSFSFLESRSGWGLDWVWPRFFGAHELAILDEVGVEHTGRLFTGDNYQRLAEQGVHPGEDFDRLIKRYGGFKRRLHRRLVRGQLRLPEIRGTTAAPGWLSRLFAQAPVLRRRNSA